ncbi:hypothetical protein U9M48_043500 [Paspalum notatum var. saurae]|uniref:Myb/SANT-like domain-containing protein n=1 Tax=Paspalum notatum var. saurae TaxID=547442 RepID=A0AAQ3XIN0_PASNO
MEQTSNKKKITAKWDVSANRTLIDIILEEISAQNRPQGVLNSKGYANLVRKFEERTGRPYTRSQHKNRWDTLKGDYAAWKTLKLSATGLGIDPKTGTIAATPQWWEEKIKAMPACKKFRHAPLENEDELDIIFDMSTCTNETARVPGVDDVVQPICLIMRTHLLQHPQVVGGLRKDLQKDL